jgi:hypothetical protein
MVQFTTGVGRLVWGHPLKMTPKLGDDGKPKLGDDGKPVMVVSFGVAFPKPEFQQIIVPKILEAVAATYPEGAPGHFAWKFVDGDATTGHRKGKPYNQREGYPGCFVMKFETNFAIPGYKQGAAGWDQITADMIKTGDYVAVGANFEAHKPKTANATPGLYTNPNGVLLVGVGQAIINGPDAQAMFGGMNFALPPGATVPGAAPMMPAGMPAAPGMPGVAPQPGMPGVAPQYAPQPQHPAYQPNPAFVQNAMAPGVAPQPGAMPGMPGFPAR